MFFNAIQKPKLRERFDNFFTRFKTIESGKFSSSTWKSCNDFRIGRENVDAWEFVASADFEVSVIVGGSNFDCARAKI